MTALFTGYVGALLDEAAANPAGAWQAKDCAIYLVTALARPAGLPHMLVSLAGCCPRAVALRIMRANIFALHHSGGCKLVAHA